MYVHWDTLVFFGGKVWAIVIVPIQETPQKIAEALVQIENDLSMELALPAYIAPDGVFTPIWPTGDKIVSKLVKIIRGA